MWVMSVTTQQSRTNTWLDGHNCSFVAAILINKAFIIMMVTEPVTGALHCMAVQPREDHYHCGTVA